jgi:integrase
MRINELCRLPLDCLIYDDKGHYSLRYYQSKTKQEHVIPLVEDIVIEVIQKQQQEVRERWIDTCPYLFPSPASHTLPFHQGTFGKRLNTWALKNNIRDAAGKLFRFQAHQFRHTVGMQLINNDVPLDAISHLLGHHSQHMTQIYARARDSTKREQLERASRKRKTVNYQGQIVRGDARANDPDVQLVRKGIYGQTLAVGG